VSVLFPLSPDDQRTPPIHGLHYVAGYVSEADEASLTKEIDRLPWDTSWERRRQPYGGAYGGARQAAPPIPKWERELADRIYRDGLTERPFDQMLVNEYQPGQGIAMHRDYEPYDRTVASLSLLSFCVMDFRRVTDKHRESILLERRSLIVLSDEARYEWEHGIARRKSDVWDGTRLPRARRLSITFRSLKAIR
jgi:alkylated DNA repair dioxygenase AlkB